MNVNEITSATTAKPEVPAIKTAVRAAPPTGHNVAIANRQQRSAGKIKRTGKIGRFGLDLILQGVHDQSESHDQRDLPGNQQEHEHQRRESAQKVLSPPGRMQPDPIVPPDGPEPRDDLWRQSQKPARATRHDDRLEHVIKHDRDQGDADEQFENQNDAFSLLLPRSVSSAGPTDFLLPQAPRVRIEYLTLPFSIQLRIA